MEKQTMANANQDNTPEVIIKKETTMEKQTGYQVLTPPKIKQRIRKAKGTPGITIETVHNAYIDITIPERPKDVNSVTFRLHIQDEIFNINWPISQSAYEALRVFFTSQKGMEGRNEI